MIWLLTRRALRARLGRTIFVALAIALSVSFVSGSFILADSMKATFDNLFGQLTQDVDLEIRTELTVDQLDAVRDPVPAELVDQIAAIDGVAYVEGGLARYAQILDRDGEPVATTGAPALGVSWTGPDVFSGVELKDGRAPVGMGETAIDKATAKRADLEIGDQVTIVFDSGPQTFELVGLIGLGNSDGFGGASVATFDPPTAQALFDAVGVFDVIDVQIEPGADLEAVQAAIADILPPRVEVVTGEQVAEETAEGINEIIDLFGTGLLVFAFVTAFVSAFIINNIFGITITQRLREIALLRAVGANTRQVRRLVVVEALLISVTGTVIGIFGGLLVAQGIIGLFNQAGAGFPDVSLQIQLRTVIVAVIVGVGITLVSVLVPSGRAARIPPVAAMRPEAGFSALRTSRRLIRAAVLTAVGAVAFLVGLFVTPGGSTGLILLGGGGALAIFIGVAGLSSVVARPVAQVLGAPIRRLFGVPGRLAADNAARIPRRTARAASALMIGVALVSAAAVFASSLRDTFGRILDRSITADYIVTDESFLGLSPQIAADLASLDELSAVTPVRFLYATVGGDDMQIAAVDPVAFPQLVNLDVSAGDFEGLADGGAMVYADRAEDLGVRVGDTIDIVYQNGVEGELPVVGLFEDNSLGDALYVSTDLLESVSDQAPRDFLVLARLADGVDPDVARPAVEAAIADFPQAKLESNAEFRASQEAQINQLLVVITVLLAVSMLIALIGIAITLALSVLERTREIGLLRAVGTTRRQLRRAIRWESVIVSVFGAVVGVVVGLLLGTALSFAVPNSVIDGITMPISTIVIVLVGSVLAGMIAAVYPARKAARMDVLQAIVTE